MALSYGRVEATFLAAVTDGPDAGDEPDLVPLRGTVSFDLNVAKIVDTSGPTVIAKTVFTGVLDADGVLCTPTSDNQAGATGLTVLATDGPTNPSGLQYRVTYALKTPTGTAVTLPSHLIAVPTDTTVNLALVIPPDAAPAIGVAAAEAAAAAAAESAADAWAAAASGGATPEQIQTAVEAYLDAHPAAVSSVNGKTGVVVIDATDVGAAPTAHTHIIGDVAGLQTALDAKLATTDAPELIRDTMGAALVAGANVTVLVDDAGEKITISATGGGGGGASNWGELGGTLSDQTDLQSALDAKANTASLGTAATHAAADFATAAQGTKADSAVQPAALDAKADKTQLPTGATVGHLASIGAGDSVRDSGINPDDLARTAALGTAAASNVEDFVAAGSLGSAASQDATAFATAAQGAKADTAVQPATLGGYVPATRTVAGHALSTDVTIAKGDVGLGNVDNTSDANKPVSTATAAALAVKIESANSSVSGVEWYPTVADLPSTGQPGVIYFTDVS